MKLAMSLRRVFSDWPIGDRSVEVGARPLLICTLCALLACVAATAVPAQDSGRTLRGRTYAQLVCAQCHAIDRNQPYSPVRGLATFQEIANAPGMSEIALSVWLRTPHRNMPNFAIDTGDREDVIAYIVSLRDGAH